MMSNYHTAFIGLYLTVVLFELQSIPLNITCVVPGKNVILTGM